MMAVNGYHSHAVSDKVTLTMEEFTRVMVSRYAYNNLFFRELCLSFSNFNLFDYYLFRSYPRYEVEDPSLIINYKKKLCNFGFID